MSVAPDIDPDEYEELLAAEVKNFLDGGDFNDSDNEQSLDDGGEAATGHAQEEALPAGSCLTQAPFMDYSDAGDFDPGSQDHSEYPVAAGEANIVQQDTATVGDWYSSPHSGQQFLVPGPPPGPPPGCNLSALLQNLQEHRVPLHAQGVDNGWYLAKVVEFNLDVESPVRVKFEGRDEERWVGFDQLKSKLLRKAVAKLAAVNSAFKFDLSALEAGLRLSAQGSDDTWYSAEIVEISKKKAQANKPILVHYMGWDRQYDEWVSCDRIKSKHLQRVLKPEVDTEKVATVELEPDLSMLKKGLHLSALSNGTWYVAEVVSVSTSKRHAEGHQ